MPILQLNNITLTFGQFPLLKQAKLQANNRERIFLIGRNGIGKSTLLKLITKEMQPDSGQIWIQPELKIAMLEQKLPEQNTSVFASVAKGLKHIGDLLEQYHELINHKPENQHQSNWLQQLEAIQQQLDQNQGWLYEQKIQSILSQFNLPPDELVANLSGGWKRRVALAKSLVQDPDLLLLDEPTNHLDLETIEWLENYLLNFKKTIICISHDRTLVNKLATRIIEIDRGQLYSGPGNLQKFLQQKEERLAQEAQENALFDKNLAKEEIWIRQGIKARRTRNEGRVRRLKELRKTRQMRQDLMQKPGFNINHGQLSGQIVLEAKSIKFKGIINNFSCRLLRGDRIGLVGPNGCGKTTLLRLLVGKLTPDAGTVTPGTNLQIAYFDQLRQQIDLNLSVIDNIDYGTQTNVISYLAKFLFTPERARTVASRLSGGELNRLLLAKLFSVPANLLVLDEPTNDLDIESLDLLEEILIDFTGTILLVSHDRTFMDNVVTQILGFNANGKIEEFIGSYSEWLQNKKNNTDKKSLPNKNVNTTANSNTNSKNNSINKNTKLSYHLQQELNKLPEKIDKLEQLINSLQLEMTRADFYQKPQDAIDSKISELKQAEVELEKAYKRWDELESNF